jgi:hypothetical protein
MSQLSREDFIELGVSIPTNSLIAWATKQLGAAKGREARLQRRGLEPASLTGLGDLISIVEKGERERGNSQASPSQSVALAQRIHEEALAYWREAKEIAKVGFGTSPDLLAKFRTGVQTGRLIANLARELEIILDLLRQHSSQLAGLGGNDAFMDRGALLLKRLKEVKLDLDTHCQALPPLDRQQCHDKGLLYDLTRNLVRVARLEFLLDPDQTANFNFTGIRSGGDVSRRPRVKKEKIGGRDKV